MQGIVESLIFLMMFLAAARGWGAIVLERLSPANRSLHALSIALGLGVWIVLGGLLNAARLALPIMLDVLLFVGSSISALQAIVWYRGRGKKEPIALRAFWPMLVIVGVVFFFLATQMPSLGFNMHDDFFAYLPRPVRMLQTGTLGGNPFDVLGVDSLGGQAFLQSFFVSRLSLLHIHGFDAVVCIGLSLALLWEMAHRRRISGAILVAAFGVILFVHPQVVNVSAVYSGSAMLLALVSASDLITIHWKAEAGSRTWPGVLIMAILLASLMALKNSFVPLAVIFCGTWVLLWARNHPNKPWLIARGFAILALTGLLLVPWLLLEWPLYRRTLSLSGPVYGGDGNQRESLGANLATAFSLDGSPWGGTFLAYGLLAVFLVVMAALAIHRTPRHDVLQRARSAPAIAAGIAGAASWLVNLYLFDPANGIRYSIPFLIPAVAIAVLFFPWTESSKRGVWLVVLLVLGLAFGQTLFGRLDRAARLRTLLSFPLAATQGYRKYCSIALGPQMVNYMRHVQARLDPGAGVLALARTPFHLDFERNRICNLNESSIANPWFADFPLDAGPQEVRSYLASLGIRYVMFEHTARGMKTEEEFEGNVNSSHFVLRRLAVRNLALRRALRTLSEHSRPVFATPDTVVFDIQ
jgi:hypothetical protein